MTKEISAQSYFEVYGITVDANINLKGFGMLLCVLFIWGVVIIGGSSFTFATTHQADAQMMDQGMMGQGLMHSNVVTNTTTSSTKTSSGIIVSIVKDAAEMTDKAYQPNPINIKVGDTIMWINRDSEMHTVTSGSGHDDTNEGMEFDSGPLTQGGIFTHTFKTVGVFNYFCHPHPWMVAKVIVK